VSKKRLTDHLQILRETVGMPLPKMLRDFAAEIDWTKDQSVQEVWECRENHRYESPIPISDAECYCGLPQKRIWTRQSPMQP
jgi:hypothetical protein